MSVVTLPQERRTTRGGERRQGSFHAAMTHMQTPRPQVKKARRRSEVPNVQLYYRTTPQAFNAYGQPGNTEGDSSEDLAELPSMARGRDGRNSFRQLSRQDDMTMWLNENDVSGNSIAGSTAASRFLEGDAKQWFQSWVMPDVMEVMRIAEARGIRIDMALSPSLWSLEDIVSEMKHRSISPTYSRNVKAQFDAVKQSKQGYDVVPLKGKDVIIGMDFMRETEAVLCCEPPQIYLRGLNAIPSKVLSALEHDARSDVGSKASGNGTRMEIVPEDWPTEYEVASFRERILNKYRIALKSKRDKPELPPKRDVEHTIPLKDLDLKMRPVVYPVGEKHMEKFTEVYNRRVEAGIWERISTSNASPVMVIGKKDADDIRLVANLKERNSNTE